MPKKNFTRLTSYEQLPHRAVVMTMIGAMLSMLMASLDQTIVGTAMPKIVSELHGFEHYSGVVTAYLIASTVVVPIAGKLSDVYGRKFFLVFGVLWFVLASACCGLAQSMTALIVFRALQGLGAGVVQTSVWSVVADLYPPAKRGRIMGVMGAVFGLSSVAGPLLGGYLTDGPGWRYAFYVNVPVGLLAIFTLLAYFPSIRPDRDQNFRIDYAGSASMIAGIVPLLLALSFGGKEYEWTSPLILSLIASSVFLLSLFFWIEKRAAHPIFPLPLFKNSVFSISIAAASLLAAGMFGSAIFIPLFVQAVLHADATESGRALMPMTLSLLVAAVFTGRGISRYGKFRLFANLGVALSALGLFLLSQMSEGTTHAELLRNVILVGLGLGISMPVFSLSVQNSVDKRNVGTATSTLQFMRTLSGSFGVALFGSILAQRFLPAFHSAIPAEDYAGLSLPQREALDRAQLFIRANLSPETQSLFSGTSKTGGTLVAAVQKAAHLGLASALHDVFLTCASLLLFASFLTLFLKELPLQGNETKLADELG